MGRGEGAGGGRRRPPPRGGDNGRRVEEAERERWECAGICHGIVVVLLLRGYLQAWCLGWLFVSEAAAGQS